MGSTKKAKKKRKEVAKERKNTKLGEHSNFHSFLDNVKEDNVEAIEQAINGGFNFHHQLSKMGAIHYAAAEGSINAFKLLVEKGVSLEATGGSKKKTPLIMAASNGRTEMVETLLQMGANINQPDLEGKTALHYAVMRDHGDIEKLLLNAGINKYKRDKARKTAAEYRGIVQRPVKKSSTPLFQENDQQRLLVELEAANREIKEEMKKERQLKKTLPSPKRQKQEVEIAQEDGIVQEDEMAQEDNQEDEELDEEGASDAEPEEAEEEEDDDVLDEGWEGLATFRDLKKRGTEDQSAMKNFLASIGMSSLLPLMKSELISLKELRKMNRTMLRNLGLSPNDISKILGGIRGF